jgi:hypothetical protein
MQRTRTLSVLGVLLVAATPAMAQNSECNPYAGQVANVCNASVDATKYFHPLMGLAITGGNPLIGSGRTLGGLGHFALGIRATAMPVQMPDLGYDGSTPEVPAGPEVPFGAPSIDAAVGLFNGFNGGILSLDGMVSIVASPKKIDNLTFDEDASTLGDFVYEIGWGARVGIFQGMGPVPSISLSYSQRSTPGMRYGDVNDGDDFDFATKVESKSYRAAFGWRLIGIDLAVGGGIDKYTGDATIRFIDPIGATTETVEVALDNTRNTAFANVGFNLGPVKLGFEGGWQGPGNQEFSTDFEDIDTDAGKFFGGVGLRLQF